MEVEEALGGLIVKRVPRNRFPFVDGPCWIWKGKRVGGYGQVELDGRIWQVHRLAFWLAHDGDLPGTHCVCHKCDVKLCCNPDHLFAGTHEQNDYDKLKWIAVREPYPEERTAAFMLPKRMHQLFWRLYRIELVPLAQQRSTGKGSQLTSGLPRYVRHGRLPWRMLRGMI